MLGEYGIVVFLLGFGFLIIGMLHLIAFVLFELIERPRYHFARKRFWRAVNEGTPPSYPPRRRIFGGLWEEDPRDKFSCKVVQDQLAQLRILSKELSLREGVPPD